MKVGIAGFAGSGKSTLFELLTGVAPDASVGIKGQLGVASLPDDRLDFLARMFDPKKITPATIDLVDLPALMGEERSENARRLALVREADGIVVMLGAYTGAEPVEEFDRFRDELQFADLEVATNRIARVAEAVKKPRPDVKQLQQELEFLKQVRDALEAGRPADAPVQTPDHRKLMSQYQFLTVKPIMPIVNVAEDDHATAPPPALGPNAASLCARLELELTQLDDEDRALFMDEMGVEQMARDRVLRAIFSAMGRICFFTGAYRTELRAWPLQAGSNAVTAGGEIHTDIERGFIRAEVIGAAHLEEAGDLKAAKAKGILRTEGRDYQVQDGDVILFLHNS